MPRDCVPPADATIPLPGGRSGRVVETISAGTFSVEVSGYDWIGRLAGAGALERHQVEACQVLQVLFERSSIRPRLTGGYDGILVDHSTGAGELLEQLGTAELAAWRRLGRVLARCPAASRSQIEAVVFWDLAPTDLARLRLGLDAAAAALGLSKR